jgi:enamine deaminase RidA (YjgF/YER057c/UK114 family)
MVDPIGPAARDLNPPRVLPWTAMATRTRRKLLTDSAALVAASTAGALLPAASAAHAQTPQTQPKKPQSQPPTRLKRRNPVALAAPRGYSHVVEVIGGRTIYVSGQVAVDQKGTVVGAGDLRAQTQQVFANLKTALEAAGATFADVVKLNFYMLDASQVQIVRDVRDTFITFDAAPASTLVEVRRLAREEFLIEVDAIANVGA